MGVTGEQGGNDGTFVHSFCAATYLSSSTAYYPYFLNSTPNELQKRTKEKEELRTSKLKLFFSFSISAPAKGGNDG